MPEKYICYQGADNISDQQKVADACINALDGHTEKTFVEKQHGGALTEAISAQTAVSGYGLIICSLDSQIWKQWRLTDPGRQAEFRDTIFSINLKDINFTRVTFHNCEFMTSELSNCNFNRATLKNVKFRGKAYPSASGGTKCM